jgi:hypothetical protein
VFARFPAREAARRVHPAHDGVHVSAGTIPKAANLSPATPERGPRPALAGAAVGRYPKKMRLDIPIPFFHLGDPLCAELDAATALDCDFCGKLVRFGTAVQRSSAGSEPFVLCAECEFGAE